MHFDAPGDDELPGAQTEQPEAAVKFWKVPSAQESHTEAPSAALKVPGEHV